MKIIKRNGKEVDFDINKIKIAIKKASDATETQSLSDNQIENIAEYVEFKVSKLGRAASVEEIQDIVQHQIMASGNFDIASNYIEYRYIRSLARKANTTDETILSLIDCVNEEVKQENSNKNPTINSTQRDYMAGEVSKDITKRLLLPEDVVEAHEQGLIHFHDSDYFAQHMHNCFSGGTKFVTDKGVRQFRDFKNGDEVYVKDKNGTLRLATVRKYGKQKMNEVTFTTSRMKKKVICTPNHRWILSNGDVTTNLKVGDRLYPTQNSTSFEINTIEEAEAFCIGFVIGDGVDLKNNATRVRLCGEKVQYSDIFEKAGYHIQQDETCEKDKVYYRRNAIKQNFINGKAWQYMPVELKALAFKGYYAADGTKKANKISTSDKRLCEFIEETSNLAGYYISSKKEEIRDTQFKKDSKLYSYHFVVQQSQNMLWKVSEIKTYRHGEVDTWCVEEPVTHSFTLEGGMVTGNCDLVNLEDMLQNGTVISDTLIEKPHSFSTACNIATQIIAQVASNQFGGQTITLSALAPFVQVSREKIKKELIEENQKYNLNLNESQITNITEDRLKTEVSRGVQTIQYQIVTLLTTNGQAPFLSVFMYLNEVPEGQTRDDLALIIEEVLKQRITGVKNEKGVWITPAFPKLLYVLQEDNIHQGDKYYYLTELAAKCTAKRLVPDYISEKIMLRDKGDVYPCMGCRSFLTPDRFTDNGVGNIANAKNYEPNKHKYYGRFNQGVVTINLVDVALTAKQQLLKTTYVNDEQYENCLYDIFWDVFDKRLELCHKALQCRHNRLKGTLSDVAPILWQYGAISRLKKGEPIDKLLFDGYSTISLGYAGLYECVKAITGESHTVDGKPKEFALKVMQYMNDKCKEWKIAENIDYSIYGTPLESTTYKFAKCLQKRFGKIDGITDHNYITNSYHVNVREKIDAFNKLKLESEFQSLSPGGAISYVEVPNMQDNIPAVIQVIRFIYDNIMYAELNTKSDYCQKCGYDGEILIEKVDDNKLIWKCPYCGNTDQDTMNVARRTCGYIGTHYWNSGRTEEIKDRVLHL